MFACMPGGQRFFTKEEFDEWLKTTDANKDGRISQEELRAALKRLGICCTNFRSWLAVGRIDRNHNSAIDIDIDSNSEVEMKLLADYMRKHWNIMVVN